MNNIVKQLRKKKRLTQEELAYLTGCSRQAVNAIEKGKFMPALPTAYKFSKLFGYPIEVIFDLSEFDAEVKDLEALEERVSFLSADDQNQK